MRQKVSNGSVSANGMNHGISLPEPVVHQESPTEIAESVNTASSEIGPVTHRPANDAPVYTSRSANETRSTVTVTWGEEKISVAKFNICTIGPFVRTVDVNPAIALEVQIASAYEELEKFAEEMRRRKLRSMAQSILETHRSLRESGIKIDGEQ